MIYKLCIFFHLWMTRHEISFLSDPSFYCQPSVKLRTNYEIYSIQINSLDLLRRLRGPEPFQYELGPSEPVKIEQYPHYEKWDGSEEYYQRGPTPVEIIGVLQDVPIEEGDPQFGYRQNYQNDPGCKKETGEYSSCSGPHFRTGFLLSPRFSEFYLEGHLPRFSVIC